MKKQNLKTYVLIGLIISSVVLTGKIWFNEKLWPAGYNFFAVITDNFSFGKHDFVSSLTKETISFPKTLVVTNFENRSAYTADSNGFSNMTPDIKELLRLALEANDGGQGTVATKQDWLTALKTRSISISYPVAYDSKLFLNILGSYRSDGSSFPVKEFIISPSIATSGAGIYIKNYDTNEILCVAVDWDRERLDNMITEYAKNSIGDLSYSSELNFDKGSTDNDQQKLVIESDVLIQLNKRLANTLEETNPVYSGVFNHEVTDNLLKHFGYNTSGVRKYTEQDNSVVFVENYSTFKIHPNGLVEYKAVDVSKGIDLKSGNDFYRGLLGCVDFVNNLWSSVFPSVPLNINISSDVIATSSPSFRLTMDYFADGAQVYIDIPSTSSRPPMKHALEIEVESGKITSYRQLLAFYETGNRAMNGLSAIDALDKLMMESGSTEQTIKELYPVYIESDQDMRISAWAALTADNETVIISE